MTQSQSWVGGMFLCVGCHRHKTQLCIWQVGDVELKLLWISFFFWCFKMKKQSEDRCAFPGHHGVTNLLFFHSVLPPSPCTSPGPAAGWRGGHMGIAGPVNQSSSFVLRGEKPSFISFFFQRLHSGVVLCAWSIVLADVCDRALCLLLCSVTIPESPLLPTHPHPLPPWNHVIALPCWGWDKHDSNVSVLFKM